MSEFAEFFEELDARLEGGKKSRALDHLFRILDRKLIAGEIETVNELLEEVSVDKYNSTVLVGFLTVTLGWKKELPARANLYTKVDAKMHVNLKGLE